MEKVRKRMRGVGRSIRRQVERRRAGKTPPAPLADRGARDTQMNNLPGKCKKNLETAFINIYFRKFPPPNPPASPCRLGRGQSPSLPLNFSGFPPGLGLPSPAPISAYLSPFSHSVLFPQVSLTSYHAHPHSIWGTVPTPPHLGGVPQTPLL